MKDAIWQLISVVLKSFESIPVKENDGVSLISGCTEEEGAVNKRERVLLETDMSTEPNHSDHRLVHQTSLFKNKAHFCQCSQLTVMAAAP